MSAPGWKVLASSLEVRRGVNQHPGCKSKGHAFSITPFSTFLAVENKVNDKVFISRSSYKMEQTMVILTALKYKCWTSSLCGSKLK